MNRFLLNPKLSKDVLKLAGPVVAGMLFQTALNIADTIMVGYLDDVNESIAGVAAIGITLPLFWAVGGFLSAISVGTQALTARRIGENDDRRAGKVLSNSLMIAISLSLLASVAGMLLVPYIFPFLNNDPEVVRYGVPYAQARFAAVFAMVTTQATKSFFDGIGKTYVAMVVSIIMNVFNLLFNAVLIFGLWGFPRWGVFGAGVGSAMASFIGTALILGWALLPRYRHRFRWVNLKNFDRYISWEIIRLSVPGGLATIFVMSGFLLFLKIVGIVDRTEWLLQFPTEHLALVGTAMVDFGRGLDPLGAVEMLTRSVPAALEVSRQTRTSIYTAGTKVIIDIMSLSFMAAIAQGTATATLVSQSLGRKNPQLAEAYGWESIKLGLLALGGLGILEAIFPHFFLGLFTDKTVVVEASVNSMRMVGGLNFFVASALIFMQCLFGAGNSRFVMFVEMLLHFTMLVPLAYLFGIVLDWRMEGVWLAACFYITLLCCILGWKFWEGKWKYIKI